MKGMTVLRADESAAWTSVLGRSVQHDFYHLPQYHALAQQREEGIPHLFAYTEGEYNVAIPLVLRAIDNVPGLTGDGSAWWDATSAYGYMGPVASHTVVPASILQNFHAALTHELRERAVVAVFSRLHPLIPQRELLDGVGEWKVVGQTISIDLTAAMDLQYARYRKNHKNGINKLKRQGVICVDDRQRVYLSEFVAMYNETMRRVGASADYCYEPEYFERLPVMLEPRVHLFVCLFESQAVCGGLFALCDGIVEFHLGGTHNDFLDLAPTKMLFDSVRVWANECGAHTFHLGGGTGKPPDSLFHFKAGFSDRRHDFAVWRWTPLPEVYHRLCDSKADWNQANRLRPLSADYFPAYRCPTVPMIEYTAP